MGKDNYQYKQAIVSTDPVTPTEHNNAGDGVQRDFELRMVAEGMVAGFEYGGSAPTLSGTTAISLPAQTGYASGRRFTAAAVYTFAAEADADYLVYLDASAEALAVTTGTVDCADDLLVAQVTWADPTLSAVVDKRLYGLMPKLYELEVPGTLSASTASAVGTWLVPDGYRFQFDEYCLEAFCKEPGSANTTYVDIHAGASGSAPATIFTTQTRRLEIPQSTAAYTTVTAGAPEANRLLTGPAIIEVYVDDIATGAEDLSLTIKGRLLPE
jgi:hypothetical protein